MAAGSDSTFFSGEIDLNKSSEELQQKYPTRPAILVKVASIVTPAKFWVYEVPLAKKTPASVETRLDRVAAIEKSLQLLYNDVIPKLEPEGYIKDLKADTMVAVRPSYRSKHWYRGRVHTVVYKHEVTAKVFLVDYGLTLENISSKACIRVLPQRMAIKAKPMAYKVNLAGLRPLTMDINYEIGMQTVNPCMASRWSLYSQTLIMDIWKKSPNKLAKLKNWRFDVKGEVHGELVFVEFDPEVSLNRLLVEHNLAEYFPELFKLDLEAKGTRKIAPRFTSICGPGPAPGAKVLDDSVDFSRTDPEELESKFVMSMLDTTESTRPPPDLDFKYLVSEEKVQNARERNAKFEELSTSKLQNASFCSSAGSIASSVPSSPGLPMTKAEFVRFKFRNRQASSNESSANTSMTSQSLWEEFRSQLEEITEEFLESEDPAKKELYESQREDFSKLFLNFPAGIDIGKFIEDAVDKMPEPILGPKQIEQKYLNQEV